MRDAMNLRTVTAMNEAQVRAWLEAVRWPNGVVCPLCGVLGESTKLERHKVDSKARDGLYQCRACRAQFSVTVGTIFEGSHLPLRTWLIAINFMCSAKKGVSALQLQRQLGIGSYRTAWHLCHRIRHMMANGGSFAKLEGVVEVDETHVTSTKPGEGKKALRKNKAKAAAFEGKSRKQIVQVLVQRGGGARARIVADLEAETLKPFIRANVTFEAEINSDESQSYLGLADEFKGGHFTVNHSIGQYADGPVTSNSAESFNALFKRALHGSWHHISREHLGRYLDEQCFRWSHKGVSDWTRTMTAIRQADGVRLYYKQPKPNRVVEGQRLVADRQAST